MATVEPTKDRSVNFTELLNEAVTKPGTLMKAYSLFWHYSLGNQILALVQGDQRGIPLGPIASFNRWKEVGRHVKRGEKAIELCMPVTCKHRQGRTGRRCRRGNRNHVQTIRIQAQLVHVVTDRWRRISARRNS